MAAREEQYRRILEQYAAGLRRVAASYQTDPSRRDDLFQDICLALWQALPHFRGEASERTYVFRVAHNRGLTDRARRRPRETEVEAADDVADPRPDPEDEADARSRSRRLQAAVRRLPLKLRQVVALRLEGLGQRETAEVLGITENNVAVRLNRAKKVLQSLLAETDETGGER